MTKTRGGTNGCYSKDIFKQLEDALEEIEDLKKYKADVKTLRQENIRLRTKCEAQAAQIAVLTAQVVAQAKLIEKFGEEIARLKKQINADSSNSSIPPSKDQKPNNVNIYNGREKSGKQSGGQNGHTGYCLSKSDIERKIASGSVKHEIKSHGTISESYTSKYIVDVKVETIVTEHRFYKGTPIPEEFRHDVQYGNDIKTWAIMLTGRGMVASNRVVELIEDITTLKLSEGSIYNWMSEFNDKAKTAIEKIETNVLDGHVLSVDGSGTRCENKNMYVRNYSNEKSVLYTMNETKGKKAIAADGILLKYVGAMVHDHDTVYYNYGTNHGECNVHIGRYLKANYEDTKHQWSQDLRSFLNNLNEIRKTAIQNGVKAFDYEDIQNHRKRYDELLASGFESNEQMRSGHFKKTEKTLLNRLKKYKDNHLLFLENFAVPFDNNLSERDLRMIKTKTKVSGCFRSLKFGRIFMNLMSVIKTAIKQNLSPFNTVREIFAN